MKHLLSAAAISALMAGTAFAGNIEPAPVEPVVAPAPMTVQMHDWSGAYIGAHAGYGWGTIQDRNNPQASKQDTDGSLFGLQAGYNWQLPSRVVLGIEADISFADMSAKWDSGAFYGKDKQKVVGSIRGRVGYAFDRFMPYLHGGLALAKNEHTLGCDKPSHGFGSCQQSFKSKSSDTVTGYTLGVGAEYAIDQSWSLKGEYAYSDYGKNRLELADPNASAQIVNRNFESKNHTVKIGINYKF